MFLKIVFPTPAFLKDRFIKTKFNKFKIRIKKLKFEITEENTRFQ